MKLRVRFNSVRLRLTKFPGGASLAYSLPVSESPIVHAEFEQGAVKIVEWSTTDAVGIYATVDASGSIEKDFECLDLSTQEDQSDMFANPATHC
jgi:hypothetical protein